MYIESLRSSRSSLVYCGVQKLFSPAKPPRTKLNGLTTQNTASFVPKSSVLILKAIRWASNNACLSNHLRAIPLGKAEHHHPMCFHKDTSLHNVSRCIRCSSLLWAISFGMSHLARPIDLLKRPQFLTNVPKVARFTVLQKRLSHRFASSPPKNTEVGMG